MPPANLLLASYQIEIRLRLDISLTIHVGLDLCAGLLLCQLEKILTGDSAPIVVLTIRDVHKGRHLQRYLKFWSFLIGLP